MVCKFKSRLYINPGNGYTVAEYSSMELDCIPSEAVISNYGTEVTFTAFGKELPCMDNVEVEMEETGKGPRNMAFSSVLTGPGFSFPKAGRESSVICPPN